VAAIDYWNRWDAENGNKTIITNKSPTDEPIINPGNWDRMHRMANALLEHPVAKFFFQNFVPERSLYWRKKVKYYHSFDDHQDIYPLSKCRLDCDDLNHDVVVDLKSAIDASMTEFARVVTKYRYYTQAVYYLDGAQTCNIKAKDFIFAAVEKSPPYGIGLYVLNERAKEYAAQIIDRDMHKLIDCQLKDEWPCYPIEPRTLELPPWAFIQPIS
jgi:exodeoxyribonuclease VIII